MSIAIKGLLLSLGVMLLVTGQLCWAYRLPYSCSDEKKHHLPYRVDVLTPVEPAPLGPHPSPPPPLNDCDEDVYDNYKHHSRVYEHVADQYKEPRPGYLQKYVLYNEEQC
ncbi:uncharacterized protein LOC116416785 [Nasonia vitripennis]|uniref:Uncharacterized protein n=1 Tax=Nasonia vitripennis TaxID=7425 RepID=A0A7M7QA25_NASVI|nr:uncharacterized protein LOC116416785 [Nasonia vitripennis]